MTNPGILTLLAHLTDALMIVTVAAFWFVLRGARREGASTAAMAWMLIAALAWGALWSWYPPLANLRLAPPPGGQVAAIGAIVGAFVLLLLSPAVRNYFSAADARAFVALGPWRIVYGALLLLMGVYGGLPAGFFWSAAIGDIFVGLWSLSILSRRASVGRAELIGWNALGLVDLLHVLMLGATYLRPFFLGYPDAPTLNLLPLVGVPLFIALHVHTLWALTRRAAGLATLKA